jgi:hypothetical protein
MAITVTLSGERRVNYTVLITRLPCQKGSTRTYGNQGKEVREAHPSQDAECELSGQNPRGQAQRSLESLESLGLPLQSVLELKGH